MSGKPLNLVVPAAWGLQSKRHSSLFLHVGLLPAGARPLTSHSVPPKVGLPHGSAPRHATACWAWHSSARCWVGASRPALHEVCDPAASEKCPRPESQDSGSVSSSQTAFWSSGSDVCGMLCKWMSACRLDRGHSCAWTGTGQAVGAP